MTSLAEVSRAAGVSIATASRVLNGSAHPVSAETRARVLLAAEQVGYARSALARALVARTSRLIGVIVGDIVNPYFAPIARGIDDVATQAGFLTMVANADRRTLVELDQLRAIREYRAAGVIFAGSGYVEDDLGEALREGVRRAREQGVRVITLSERGLDCPTIAYDNRAVGYDVTDYLISLGHRRIAFVDGPEGLYATLQRAEGFCAAMRDAGLEALADRYPGTFDFEAGYTAAGRMMASKAVPDAVIGANDEVAIGALTAFRHAGIDVPRQVSVAGIDDLRVARFLELTTVSVPLYELGAMAARFVTSEEDAPATTVLPHRLVPRATTERRRHRATP